MEPRVILSDGEAPKSSRTFKEIVQASPRKLRNVLRAQDFSDRGALTELFKLADWLEKNPCDVMRGKRLVWYATEASTRTRLSFSFAAENLGGTVHAVSASDSSQEKGESIEDTILSIATMGAHVIVLRHSDEDAIWRAARVCPVPLLNGGSGAVHHPTQALLDAYTIFRTVGKLDGLSIALIGDLKYGRTTNSLAYLLSKYQGISLYLVSPEHLRMKGELVYYLDKIKGLNVVETTSLERVIDKVDVVYQTRRQLERGIDPAQEQASSPIIIDPRTVEKMRDHAVILHPLPRKNELPREVDTSPKAKYIDQMYYGELIRRATLAKIFG